MKIEHFDVLLSKQTEKPYTGGEAVQGHVEINVLEKIKVGRLTVKLIGQAQTGWKNKNSEVLYESNEQVLNEYIDLTRVLTDFCDENFNLGEGLHQICFHIPLPLDVISSIEKENYGWVRYTCSATLDVLDEDAREIFAEHNFTVFSLLNLDAPYMRQPVTSYEENEIRGCCCNRKVGIESAQLTVSDMGLLPGEIAKITLVIEDGAKRKRRKSRKNRNDCVLLSLCQQLDFLSQNRYELHLFDRKSLTIAVESIGTCKVTSDTGPEIRHIDFQIPIGLQPTSVKANGLITISYFFRLDMHSFDVIVPVIIGSMKTPGSIDE
ncbi:arrestin domain protein [Onchocerca flexuosa]|uniref:Arrestin domain protein n=2 Tax=Onchocerca flexuosa TaxID=387005 RepID=A0A238C0X6_9BILA|nr:arrestin domain protein [Onchocerca flexuosa]